MDIKDVTTSENETTFSIFKVLYKNLFLIILVTVIGLLASVGVAFLKAKPTYTATKRVMFITKYSQNSNTAGNDVILAKLYLPNAVDKLKSQIIILDANDVYNGGEGEVVASAISAKYGDESLIFSLSYTDYTAKAAEEKLKAVIESAKINFPRPDFSVAKDSTLREVENRTTIIENSNFGKFIILGTIAGFVLSVLYVVIKEASDNTLRDRETVEAITGVSLLACIEDAEAVEKRRKARLKKKQKESKKKGIKVGEEV